MTREEISKLTDTQLDGFITSMGDSKSVLLERAKEERKRRNPREPMTETEARDIVATMRRETKRDARRKVMELALIHGNLSNAAKAVYRAELESDA